MSAEAGPSSVPLFKKRGKSGAASRISSSVIDEPATSTASTSSTDPDSAKASATLDPLETEKDGISVQDLIALRSLNRRPTGIDLERLNKGERKKKKQKEKSASQLEEERWEQQMKRGGLMTGANTGAGGDDDDSDEE